MDRNNSLYVASLSKAPNLCIANTKVDYDIFQGSHRLEKYLNLEGFLEKSLKIQSALKSTGKSLESLEFLYFL